MEVSNYLKEVLAESKFALLKKKNVVAVGIGFKKVKGKKTKRMSIVCSVTKKLPKHALEKKDLIPKLVGTVWTDVIETGEIKALKALTVRTRRHRPAPGGVSIGHEWITAGTLGCLVRKSGSVIKHILSNNHVLADSNNAPIDSAILPPGKYDGGESPRDRIATLTEFIPIQFLGGEGCSIGKAIAWLANLSAKLLKRKTRLKAYLADQPLNYVDAAIATPVKDEWVMDEILDIGKIAGVNREPSVGLPVKKSGRTTELTEGKIEQLGVISQEQYGDSKIAIFDDQIMTGKMCAGGDSGSAVLDEDNKLVGLLFAGSDECTIINPISYVFDLLDLTI